MGKPWHDPGTATRCILEKENPSREELLILSSRVLSGAMTTCRKLLNHDFPQFANEDSFDIADEALERMFKYWRGPKSIEELCDMFWPWARRVLTDRTRRFEVKYKERFHNVGDVDGDCIDPQSTLARVVRREQLDLIFGAFERLALEDERLGTIMKMRASNCKLAEIAEHFEISERTVAYNIEKGGKMIISFLPRDVFD